MNTIQINTLEQLPAGLTFLSQQFAELTEIVRQGQSKQHNVLPPPLLYRTRKETAAILKITLATLHEYTQSGKIIGSRIGNRVLYTDSDIQAALKNIKTPKS